MPDSSNTTSRARANGRPSVEELLERCDAIYEDAKASEKLWVDKKGDEHSIKVVNHNAMLAACRLQAELCGYLGKDAGNQTPKDLSRAEAVLLKLKSA